MRSKNQFLEMIARTRPSAFAVSALEAQLQLETYTPDELEEVRAALDDLRTRLEPVPASAPSSSRRAQLNVEYRAEGMGGRGRIYADVDGRKLRDLLENDTLDAAQVYVFTDNGHFAGFQVDNAAALPDRLEPVLLALEGLNLERVDCAEAGLEDVSLGDVLRWVVNRKL
jgi:hypothetical protein